MGTNYHQGEASQIHEEHQHEVAARRVVTVPSALTTLIDDQNTIIYLGQAAIGSATSDAVWQIRKIETVAQATSIKYADGDYNFDNIWDNRASLIYS